MTQKEHDIDLGLSTAQHTTHGGLERGFPDDTVTDFREHVSLVLNIKSYSELYSILILIFENIKVESV